jgi:[ribosomal protein S5]-alanine N-acetyltransferase
LPSCVVRSWRVEDAESVAKHANNRKIWLNLRDAFPHPYTLSDAVAFIEHAISLDPETRFAITVDDEAVGYIGYTVLPDVERVSAEIGYWLSEEYWGRGIMVDALRAVTEYAMREHNLTRVFAVPFHTNTASSRVLEKCGYEFEGRMRKNAIKEGKILDQMMWAFVKDEGGEEPPFVPPRSGGR